MRNLIEAIDKAKEQYERDGVAVIPGLFSKDEVNKIRASAFMALTKLKSDGHLQRKPTGDIEFPALMFHPAGWNEYLNAIRCDARIVTVVREFLGDNVRQLNNQIYFRLPGDGDEFAWHQDISFRTPRSAFNGIETAYLQTLIVVDEMDEANGAVEYIPGSHKWGDQSLISSDGSEHGLRSFKRGNLNGVKIPAKPGDFMIWSVMVVHGSERNDTQDRPRMTYMNGFASADASPDSFQDYLKNGEVIKTFV